MKEILAKIQDILNTDVKDVDTKMQVAELLESLSKDLAEYADKLQDEIFDEMMNSQGTVETRDLFDFTEYDYKR